MTTIDTDDSTVGPQYYYPNRMGKIILSGLQDIVSAAEYAQILEVAGLPQFIERLPANDLDLAFPFSYVAQLQQAAETVCGVEQGRELNRLVGRTCFSGGLQEFHPLLGIADLPVRIMPLSLKLRVGFDMFAIVFNRFTDQTVSLSESPTHYLWVIQRCPVCWQRQTDAPCCHLAVGILEASLEWATAGKQFEVIETQCIAKGDDTCTIEIGKRPLKP